jgi:hypothetical protein
MEPRVPGVMLVQTEVHPEPAIGCDNLLRRTDKMEKKNLTKRTLTITCAVFVVLLPFAIALSFSQSEPAQAGPETIQCSAQGTSTQSGQLASLTIRINKYSTAEERKTLIDAFKQSGSKGLYEALKKMPSIGRIEIAGRPGCDLKFIRLLPNSPAGIRKLRIVTDRPIAVAEAWKASTRTMQYNLSALDIELDSSNLQDKSKGVLVPACELVIDKNTKEINIKAYQNPWKLFNFFGVK